MVYSPSQERMHQLGDELRQHAVVQMGHGVEDVVAALVEDPPPRPQIFVIDLDLVPAADLFHLHAIRQQGWCGAIIALGAASIDLQRSLNIDVLLPAKLEPDTLRDAVAAIRFDAQTMPLPIVDLALLEELSPPPVRPTPPPRPKLRSSVYGLRRR